MDSQLTVNEIDNGSNKTYAATTNSLNLGDISDNEDRTYIPEQNPSEVSSEVSSNSSICSQSPVYPLIGPNFQKCSYLDGKFFQVKHYNRMGNKTEAQVNSVYLK